MSYNKNNLTNLTSQLIKVPGLASDSSTILNSRTSASGGEFYELEPGEVLDFIETDSDLQKLPEELKTDQSYIGAIQVRPLYSGKDVRKEDCPFARPLSVNEKFYPAIGEIVILVEYVKGLYYKDIINIDGNINNNAQPDISINKLTSDTSQTKNYKKNTPPQKSNNKTKLGKVLIDKNDKVKPLQPHEGNYILEGKFGNSIRFGSNKNNEPHIKIRNGQATENDSKPALTYIEEDINKDKNSIWLIENDTVAFIPDTKEAPKNTVEYKGNQILINSDKIVFNSKVNELAFFGKKNIGFSTDGEFCINATKDIIINSKANIKTISTSETNIKAGTRTVIDSPKVLIGSNGSSEPLVLGNKWKAYMTELLNAIIAHIHKSGSGPTDMPLNDPKFSALIAKLDTILSKKCTTE